MRKSLCVLYCFIIFLCCSGLIQVHAQTAGVSPTFNCLGPCASNTPSGPAVNTTTNSLPVPSSLPIATSGIPGSSSQPCNVFSPNFSSEHSGRNFGQDSRLGRGGGRGGFLGGVGKLGGFGGGSYDDSRGGGRRGFLGDLFKLLLVLLSTLLTGNGSSSLSLPCSPAISGTPVATQPSTPPAPVVPAISPTIINPSSTGSSTQPANVPTETSDNWGGYVVTTTFPTNSKITSNWIVSALDCSSGDGKISPWPGFGGWAQGDSTNIAQLGNDMVCSSGHATYPAWTQAFPAGSIYSNNTMKAGDHMTATVTFQGGGKFATTMTNQTQNWTITTPMDFNDTSYTPKTAEVIFEAVSDSNSKNSGNNQKIPVPKFAPLSFTNAVYSNGAQQLPLASGQSLEKINLGVNNDIQVTTGQISGSNFTQTFVHN